MKTAFFGTVFLLVTIAMGSPARAAFAPPHHNGPRAHSLTIGTAYLPPSAYDKTFGSHNWAFAAKYLDVALTGPRNASELHGAGLGTAMYLDVHQCSSKSGPGPNEYPAPDCGDWPASAFYTQDGYADRTLTVSYNNRIVQRLGNPGSPELQARARASIDGALREGRFDLVQFDDATTPDEWWSIVCNGIGMFEPWGYDCASAPGGKAHRPWSSRFSVESWKTGVSALAEKSPIPAVFNGLQGYAGDGKPAAIADVVAKTPNAWGAICDTCFYGLGAVPKNPAQWTGPLLESRLNGSLRVVGAGKNVIVVNHEVTDPGARARGLADVMLFYDADRVWRWDGACGDHSHIPVCPEAALTFYKPYGSYPGSTAALRDGNGNYVREFAECFENARPLGPCAAVVNPDRSASHPRPALRNAYAHTLTIAGDGLCACYGDSGSVAVNGPRMPENIPAAAGFVAFR
ncbi:MAG: hypothetical protein GIW95_00175 [Candidatus Eremiobacteraeota bacterium]|nr:hypothetical protein [Candidatus Eremiobacteraeota bacterium]